MTPSLQIGSATIVALTDGEGPFFADRTKAFRHATAEQWAAADRFDPGAVTGDGRWWLQFRAFAIRDDTGITVVDAGIGPADAPAASWAPVPGRLPDELAAAGIDPAEVDTVVLTHLHTDHVGWAVVADGPGRRPFFDNARYILQRTEIDAVEELNPGLRETLLDPLCEAGRLAAVDGERALTPRSRVVPTPGHTPGHQSVLVESGGELVAVTGDVLVHALQLLHPETAYEHESDPHRARESREALLRRVAEANGSLATPHLTEPFAPARA
ncbi:MBL fold metallo-hydrolase [Glycomyces arizonensis]|uniref:MBL fold metallo-hydrolase n=1 Tax=Glycomyces arizonensis TaxID=256035 RepID=UPI0004044080|nr:MBL fold metallo-hydrolase [Glycomyces arizonensis]